MWILIALLVLAPVDSLLSDNVAQNYTSINPCTDQNHLFLLPGALTAGSSSRACISRFVPDGPALALMKLNADGQETKATRELPPGDGGCLDLPVPLLPNTKAEVTVSIRYPLAQCTWERRVVVRIASGRLIVLHTERGRYRPGDMLRVRALVLRADLAPVHGSIDEIWLEGPRGAWEGTRAASWARVRTRLGIGQVQHELDARAPSGRWTVRARLADGSQGSEEFWVGNYEIPPFQLSVRHAAKVLRTSERLVWTVCVRYPWTEAVEGMLVIRLRGAGGNFDTDETPGVRTAVRLRTPKACHRHAVAARRIGLNGATPPDVVVADFSFQEEGTRIWQNTTVVSQVVDKPITLEFLAKHRAVIAPGLPYKLKIKATRWDDKPAANERVRVCRTAACDEAVTDARGVARVMFTADDDSDAIYKFQATLKNDSTITAAPLYLPVRHTGALHAALGPLRSDANAARSFVPLYLSSKDVDTALTVHFVVITRGGIIYRWGVTTQCPVSSSTNQIYTAARNSRCSQTNLGYSTYQLAEDNTSDSLLDRHLLRVMLPIKLTHQMCPDSHLITYFYYKGELVSASKHIEMEECFANKVEATWLSRQVAPGASASLSLTTHGLSLCALTAVDAAARGAAPAPSIRDAIMMRLRRLIEAHRNLTEYDAAGECFLTTDTTDIPSSSMELTTRWLAAAGVRAAGGAPISRRCVEAPLPLVANDASPPRSDFLEAWLWRLVAVGANGSAVAAARAPDAITRYEATAVCVARNGIAVSQPAVLQVFREFFIHADGPKRLRRGDSAIIQYRIFNYLYEPLSIQIQVLTDPHLEVSSEAVHAVCVGARAAAAWRVALHAALPGAARLALRAAAVRDGACGGAASGLRSVWEAVHAVCVGARAAAAWRVALHAALPGAARLALRAAAVRDGACGGAASGLRSVWEAVHAVCVGARAAAAWRVALHAALPGAARLALRAAAVRDGACGGAASGLRSVWEAVHAVCVGARAAAAWRVALHAALPGAARLALRAAAVRDGACGGAASGLRSVWEAVHAVCVGARAAAAWRVALHAALPGAARLALRAAAVRDGACGGTASGLRSVWEAVHAVCVGARAAAAWRVALHAALPGAARLALRAAAVRDGACGGAASGLRSVWEAVHAVCVGARAAAAWRVALHAALPGAARLALRAAAVRDGACGGTASGLRSVWEAVHAVCVGARAAAAWRVALHAALPGAARLALRAAAVRDGACGGTASGLRSVWEAVHAVCVGARAAAAWRVALHAALPGAARLALRAAAVRDGACGGTASGLSDEVIIQIQVDPEGVPVQDQHSALLCGRGSPESRTSEVSWSWPDVDAVPGTEAVTVWAIGDIIGPLLADADSLVLLPRGCGEQNMARLATNLLALKQLDPASAAAAAAKEHVARGFTRQLQYVHSSGGFSAFGSTDEPSTWLTAFAMRYLRKAHEVLSPGLPTPPALDRAERWLLGQQMENGCFRNEGQVFHRELKGGLNEDGEIANVALTAYVITSLVESSPNLPYTVLRNTLSCLRALPPLKTKTPTRVYAHAVLAYAFMRLRKYEDELRKTNEASPWENEALENDEDVRELVQLMRMAKRKEELVWWETNSLATSVEATGYALLALAACAPALAASCAHDARGAARWLAARRGPGGGFVATQDTLVALEALTAWSATQPPTPAHLNVTVRAGGIVASAVLTPEVKVPEVMKIGLGKLDVAVEGSGCALVQATRSYHTLAPPDDGSRLSVQVSVRTDGPFDCAADGSGCFCAAVVEACVLWSGEFPEMALLDIALPGGFGADAALLYALLREPHTLLRRIELSANAGRATLYLAARGPAGGLRRCFPVHAVGPAAATRPAHARLADYYAPAVNDTQMYTIPEDCPAKISHRSNDYLRSDNLFTKAISEDSGEIIITDEFSFEDVPEGIPLEDPMYDNLTQVDEEKSNVTDIKSQGVGDNLQKASDENNSEKQINNEKATSKLESENEIIRIDDKIERNFEKDEFKSNMQTTTVNPVVTDAEKELEGTPASNSETEVIKNGEFKRTDSNSDNEHKIEIRDDTKQEEEQAAGVDNPQLSRFHVIDSERDLDVPSGVEGPVPAVVLPPPNFVPIPTNTAYDSAAFPSIQANPKAFYSYPQYSYYVYTELPRFSFR